MLSSSSCGSIVDELSAVTSGVPEPRKGVMHFKYGKFVSPLFDNPGSPYRRRWSESPGHIHFRPRGVLLGSDRPKQGKRVQNFQLSGGKVESSSLLDSP